MQAKQLNKTRAKQSKENARETIELKTIKTIDQIMGEKFDGSKTIEHNVSKIIKAGTAKYFLTCIDNILAESRQTTTLIRKSITRYQMTGR